eukprot:766766-Hanusia_phi.AAC.6
MEDYTEGSVHFRVVSLIGVGTNYLWGWGEEGGGQKVSETISKGNTAQGKQRSQGERRGEERRGEERRRDETRRDDKGKEGEKNIEADRTADL